MPRIQLDMLHPNIHDRVRSKQELEKQRFDSKAGERQFIEGDPVFSRSYNGKQRWKAGSILRRTGPVSFDVQVGDSVEHRHASQLRSRRTNMTKSEEQEINKQILLDFDEQQGLPDQFTNSPARSSFPATAETPVSLAPGESIREPLLHLPGEGGNFPAAGLQASPTSPEPKAVPPIPLAPPAPPPPERRVLRDRGMLHARPKFADEYSKLGSKKN